MKKTLLAVLSLTAVSLAGVNGQVKFTEWTFSTNSTTPTLGSGVATLVGNTTSSFALGASDYAWNTTSYKSQSTGSGTAGVQFLASTVGYQNIALNFKHRSSGTASRWAQIDYTIDGGSTWTSGFWNNSGALTPHDTFYSFSVDFSSVELANNNPSFGLRIVSIFSPQAFDENSTSNAFAANSAYMRANAAAVYSPDTSASTGSYGTSGTWRFDDVSFSGVAVPEPSTWALIGLGSAFVLLRMRRKAVI